ncbi:major facilitator superfamily transporter multidrug:cation transporter [Enterococcus phoeniculicola]|jgi:DHA1 family multidrug resistance protein-like MFS transporter|uniref:Major facilitator superfamily transporter multidrug:cation transporter n=1 Tax=Enterococcus phoeniculicola ATCC BAA-412 TaxID=1158610 RepID=R3W2H8_9ENTE|nr:multidrug efflux MFS transporter [Enterococcus phoeniculicola]EOL41862.1 major facilitator superfamily transporter multidrug:cation transporter [Enterococcus phoeniculicola ATCC BAA-412]EOT79859.1 major facilitator superfamily transporter multidrug:cation transporter [Enterococcus phoeniculicola ATCC BAA-412]OJG70252.1 major facilitator superfamily transporter multidrug:cation transporter [Enterococcus phoeniculicola]
MKIEWKKNLMVAWLGCFFTGASISLVMPFIPVYVEQLGTPKNQIELFSGLAISVTAFAAAIVAPIWGNLADRKGRKIMMIRAAAGMTITMGSLAFVPNVYWLLIMRFFNGVLSGYIPNATAMIASQAPREKSGWALGTLSTGAVAGNLIGPSMGGALAQWFGMENVFIITGVVLLITTLLTIFMVKEEFHPVEKSEMVSIKELFSKMDNVSILIGLFVTTLILQLGVTSISPILTLYIRSLSGDSDNILFVSGLIVSIAGVSAVISSPTLGKLGDKIGNHKVLLAGLVLSFFCFIPMAFVKTPFQLGVLRFILGFSTGALMPSINTLIGKITPEEGVSRIYSYNQMFSNFGQVLGPMVGSTVAHSMGYSSVFIVTSCFVLANILLSSFNFRKMMSSKF